MGLSKSVSDLLRQKESLDNEPDEVHSENEVEISGEEKALTLESDLVLLGIVWNAIRPHETFEKLKTRYYVNENLVVEKGNNSFWIYGKEDLISESIVSFVDYFAKDIRDFKFVRPESPYDSFIYYFFKEAIMCRLNVLVSNSFHERDLQQVIIKDVIRELKDDARKMDNINKKYHLQMIDNWISQILVKNTHLSM
ncbi:hypothetical protein ACVS8I_003918 [Escherichia coli]|uniref:Uncharacterized protein n=5 Tax=Enterobacteriaceae TaxID=543 RepID=A0A5U1KQ72_SALER|nr:MULTISPECIES: hypothetical protein [Enterobacteriaceae]EAV5781038.1 hypothetical protein [Salmonella enterica]EBK1945026.1 hypothetical protein [Salmonella enterica subsp. enterica serovar Montevideo]EBM9693673.1 hypothetical protein [Salmonella enterica subsp. enterica serovar Infantis]ECD7980993.1 hypothetical protein [Salmonella enterica subsp. enterica serovar Indiana]ECH1063918.1 hypothetical protein [Salmonella enterica subsp. enterica serovar Enteritidis]ECI6674472.1 hypothetical pr